VALGAPWRGADGGDVGEVHKALVILLGGEVAGAGMRLRRGLLSLGGKDRR